MRINYLLLVHSTNNFKRLLERLADEEVFFYIHVDAKVDIQAFKQEATGIDHVKFIENRENIIWGNISMVKATLHLMREVLSDYQGKCYSILMSGSDYPIKSKRYIQNYLEQRDGKIFISSDPVHEVWDVQQVEKRLKQYNVQPPSKHRMNISLDYYHGNLKKPANLIRSTLSLIKYNSVKTVFQALQKREFPFYLDPYGGSQWWALPMEVLEFTINFIDEHPDYLTYHEDTYVPDEIFFHSIISSSFPKNVIEPSITHVDWTRKNCALPVTFSADDFEELKESNTLFARKFDPAISSTLLDKIDDEILTA